MMTETAPPEEKPQLATIPVPLVNTILAYLSNRPYKEVAAMVSAIQSYAKPIP